MPSLWFTMFKFCLYTCKLQGSVLYTKMLWLFELFVFSLAEFAAPAPLHSPNFNPFFYFNMFLGSILSLVFTFLLDGFSFFTSLGCSLFCERRKCLKWCDFKCSMSLNVGSEA